MEELQKNIDRGIAEVVNNAIEGHFWPFPNRPVTLAIGMLVASPGILSSQEWTDIADSVAYRAKVDSWNDPKCQIIVADYKNHIGANYRSIFSMLPSQAKYNPL